MSATDPRGLLALLSKDDLLRVVAALALDTGDEAAIARLARLSPRRVAQALGTLQAAGLASRADEGWRLERERFAETLARVTAKPTTSAPAAIRQFFRGERLLEIPARRAKRLVLLRHLAERFEPGHAYRESEVDAILREVHPDHAALRRYLVDERLLTRSEGIYERAAEHRTPYPR